MHNDVCVVGANLRVCPVCGDIRNAHSPRHAQYAALRCRATIVAQGATVKVV
ncbi:MAG: hypothetical protein LBQ76_08015 [Candidatus Fibromonas sp.]|nr:hypothetical protein [Candidatus Fibromonas sp.]